MKKYVGKSVGEGIAFGKIRVIYNKKEVVKRVHTSDAEIEIRKYDEAKIIAAEELDELYKKALENTTKENAKIFEMHKLVLEDETFDIKVRNMIINQDINAEYAVAVVSDNLAADFEEVEDEYLKARVVDIRDVSERLIRKIQLINKKTNDKSSLNNVENRNEHINTINSFYDENNNVLLDKKIKSDTLNKSISDKENCFFMYDNIYGNEIIVALDLTPSETIQLDKSHINAFVTIRGSVNSHTAILARSMGLPALVATSIDEKDLVGLNGKYAVVDAIEGNIYIEPDKEKVESLLKIKKNIDEKIEKLKSIKNVSIKEISNGRLKLYANVGSVEEIDSIKDSADGIGLFRTEFIFLDREIMPSEEEQFEIYKKATKLMGEKRVIIRTLDIGADKTADYIKIENEENPAMGLRAIRLCLDRPDIFKTQLRAIFRASAFGNIAIMYPMITSLHELYEIKSIVGEVKNELTREGVIIGNPKEGVMIETPAAAIISDLLAKEVDFFSVGTNDLSQYVLAMDRQNSRIDRFFDDGHEAIKRLLKMIIHNAHKAGIEVEICGELAGNTNRTKELLDYGVDGLSVSPGRMLNTKGKLLEFFKK